MSDAELAKRRKAWKAPQPRPGDGRGYRKLFMGQITQADKGCDFEFLMPEMTARVPRAKR
ncbi:dihydroxy-acid dehydratase [compost metagenome]